MTRKFAPLPEDPNAYWFWLQPLPPFDVRYAANWQAKAQGFIGPFSFRACAERERTDRLIARAPLRLIGPGRKESL